MKKWELELTFSAYCALITRVFSGSLLRIREVKYDAKYAIVKYVFLIFNAQPCGS